MKDDYVKLGGICFCGCVVVVIITVLASIKSLERDDQMVIEYLGGKEVVNGPGTKVMNPFRSKTRRKALRLSAWEYAKIKDHLTGSVRIVSGPVNKEFLGAYEDFSKMTSRAINQEQYMRMIDRYTGEERMIRGPNRIVPKPYEEFGIPEAAVYITVDTGAFVKNFATGELRLVTERGRFVPEAYEHVIEQPSRFRVLSTEAVVMRTVSGSYVVHNGASGVGSAGTAFFLKPYEKIMEMTWSSFSEPQEGGKQAITKETVSRIDLRPRNVFYQYEVRTMDNVALTVEGTINYQVVNVEQLVARTADPVGDVWYKARNVLIAAVSQVTLQEFMGTFNPLIKGAFAAQTNSSFWSDRGLKVNTMQVTKYECLDREVAETLQEIIEETTNRRNRLQQQRSANDVAQAKLQADIRLEKENEALVRSQAKNQLLVAELDGEAEGVQLSKAAQTFIDGLNASLPSVADRVEIYKLQEALNHQNARTASLGNGKATMFLTPDDLHLNLNTDGL